MKWQQLPKPASVRYLQCVDRSLSKQSIGIESKLDEGGARGKELTLKIDRARKVYGSVLSQSLQYGGQDVGLITYKSTREWIEAECCVPRWLKRMHFGATTGTNDFERVRALFVLGRPLATAEDLCRMAEAWFGKYIPDREYHVKRHAGAIPIVPDVKGNNIIRVNVLEMADENAQRFHRQVTHAALIQAVGRARAGLRGPDEPLDLWLVTDTPLPELGPVEPFLWEELDAGLDGVMLAAGGVWLERVSHAAGAYSGLFKLDALKQVRLRAEAGGVGTSPIGVYYRASTHTSPFGFSYRQKGSGKKTSRGVAIREPASIRPWLEGKLGPLAHFEMEEGKRGTGNGRP
jgi:hypothetical protein